MKVAITAKLKNGILWEAVGMTGSQAALARYLGIGPSLLGEWLHFSKCPDFDNPGYRDRYAEVDSKLIALTGHSLEETFPVAIRNKAFLKRKKRVDAIVEMPVEQLISIGAAPRLPPAPDALLFEEDRNRVIEQVLSELRPRERDVLRMRFGLNDGHEEHTYREIAKTLGVTTERARQIETVALNKLRHKAKRKKLMEAIS